MAIKVVDEPDIYLTASELAKWRERYNQAFMFFAGTPPTLNAWIARQLHQRPLRERIRASND